jgi:hypothetical protein
MKKFLVPLVMVVITLTASSTLSAQDNDQLNKRSVSQLIDGKGFWVIESNIKKPKAATVHFYTMDNDLMYSEKIEGIKLDVKKQKTVKTLNRALLQTLITWHRTKQQQQDQQLVKSLLKSQ